MLAVFLFSPGGDAVLKPLRRCKKPGCRMLTSDGYCPEHKPKPKPEKKESAAWHYLYVDPRYGWAKRRSDQLITEPFCRECAAHGIRTRATEVDHIVPHKGNVELFMRGDLQSLCHSCHSRKTMAENSTIFGRFPQKKR